MDAAEKVGQEWLALQGQFERYEGGALTIKLTAVILFAAGMVLGAGAWLVCLVLLVLWLQEGIFKTFQSRLGERLLELERLLATGSDTGAGPFQLHTRWNAARRGFWGRLVEYAASACRPTVAFPYLLLLLASLLPLLQ